VRGADADCDAVLVGLADGKGVTLPLGVPVHDIATVLLRVGDRVPAPVRVTVGEMVAVGEPLGVVVPVRVIVAVTEAVPLLEGVPVADAGVAVADGSGSMASMSNTGRRRMWPPYEMKHSRCPGQPYSSPSVYPVRRMGEGVHVGKRTALHPSLGTHPSGAPRARLGDTRGTL